MTFALAGNQNCGKTTLFNRLTGSNRHAGNFPGVTMDCKSGKILTDKNYTVVDLPGIYSMRAFSEEEKVARDFLINGKPDAIINIADATNIERNLYLTLQFIELQIPMVLALNMMDEFGGSIDIKKLSDELGIPVVPVSALKNKGIKELTEQTIHVSKNKILPRKIDFYKGAAHRCIHSLIYLVKNRAEEVSIAARFAAVKMIEADPYIFKLLKLNKNETEAVEYVIKEMEAAYGADRNTVLAQTRYSYIEKVCKKTVVKSEINKEQKRSFKIDGILTDKYLALPLFMLIMLLVFWLSFEVIGVFLSDFFARGIDYFTQTADTALKNNKVNPIVQSLVVNGIFKGVGSVLGFLPIIVTLFFFLSILEDSGYMARVAFITDKLFRKTGLSGRSIVPMLIGFGCSVPAIMASRAITSERDRKITILLTPFISCSAKIPIYAVFTAAFFEERKTVIMASLYLLGIIIGIICAVILNKTRYKGKPAPFLMELPNYRMPSLKSVILLMRDKAKEFIQRAFTVIFIASVAIWFLQSFDANLKFTAESAESLLAGLGKIISPIFTPLGFGDWRISTALITGITAKETVISTLAILTGSDIENVKNALAQLFNVKSAFAFLTFTLLYTPCFAAIAAMRKELGSGFYTFFAVTAQCAIAWAAAFLIIRPIVLTIIIILLCVIFSIDRINKKQQNKP